MMSMVYNSGMLIISENHPTWISFCRKSRNNVKEMIVSRSTRKSIWGKEMTLCLFLNLFHLMLLILVISKLTMVSHYLSWVRKLWLNSKHFYPIWYKSKMSSNSRNISSNSSIRTLISILSHRYNQIWVWSKLNAHHIVSISKCVANK